MRTYGTMETDESRLRRRQVAYGSSPARERRPYPSTRPARNRRGRSPLASLCLLLLLLTALYLTPPLLLVYSSWVRDAMIFVHHVKTPFFANISNPASFGLKSVRQFELFHQDGCRLEVWQLLPHTYHDRTDIQDDATYDSALSDGSPVVLYLHGNTGTRATYHRVGLYRHLAETLGTHVVTFDYRGFGNSECYPSEQGMMEDGLLVWQWLRRKAPGAKVFIWGHSLGSAAATYVVSELSSTDVVANGSPPLGLILDAPFPDIIAAAENHPFSLPYWPWMPLFSRYILQSFHEKFESAGRLGQIKCPVLILHGQQDWIVPYHLGRRVYEVAVESREENPYLGRVEFVDCGNSGHKSNWESPQAREAVKQFVQA